MLGRNSKHGYYQYQCQYLYLVEVSEKGKRPLQELLSPTYEHMYTHRQAICVGDLSVPMYTRLRLPFTSRRPAAAAIARTAAPPRRWAHAPPQFDLAAIRAEIEAEHIRASGLPCTDHSAAQSLYTSAASHWHWLDRELSSNVAGETGAVCIYDGAAAALRWRGKADESTLAFIEEHRAAEQSHLDLFEALIPSTKHTRLLPVWKLAGFTLGFAPAMVSDRALFLTVEAVETFVEEHYQDQIVPLREHGRCPELVALLEHCCADEIHHKVDAAERAAAARGSSDVDGSSTSAQSAPTVALVERAWMRLVGVGSAVAAEVARRV